jgi:uncharacterized protein (TIGR02996 family)
MRDEEALLGAIDHEPHDDLPRLAYADWLDENGQPDRAEFIRIQCRLADLSPLDADQVPLEVREAELLRLHEDDWLRRSRGPASAAVIAGFARGFPVVRVPADGKGSLEGLPPGPLGGLNVTFANAFIDDRPSAAKGFWSSARLGRAASLAVRALRNHFQAEVIAECRHLSHLRSLELYAGDGYQAGPWDKGLAALARSPHLSRLRRFVLSDSNTLTSDGLLALADSPWIGGVRHLGLSIPARTDAGIEPIARSPAFCSLESLDLSWDRLWRTAFNLFEIVESQTLARLRFLRFYGGMDKNEIQMLADSEALGRLRGLSLMRVLSDESAIALANSPHLGQMGYLDLPSNLLGPRGVRALACSANLTSLRALTLTNNGISDAGAVEIAQGESMANLTALSLNKTGIGDVGARALADSSHLSNLLCLDLSDCAISDIGVRALADSTALKSLRLMYLAGNERVTEWGFEMLRKSPNLRLINDPRRITKVLHQPPEEPDAPEDEWE